MAKAKTDLKKAGMEKVKDLRCASWLSKIENFRRLFP